MTNCKYCGCVVEEEDRYCMNCGRRLQTEIKEGMPVAYYFFMEPSGNVIYLGCEECTKRND